LDGLHVVANLYRCRGDARYLTDAEPLRQFCLDQVNRVGLTVLGDLFHQFPDAAGHASGGGVTGCVVLAESHLAIHTWPELGSVTVDVYVCNYTQRNDDKAREVIDAVLALFQPEDFVRHDVPRDHQFLYEWLNEDYGFFLRSSRRVQTARTAFQDLEVHETPQFGRLFRLDGCFMTSEKDEFYYHENLIHPAMVTHPNPRRVLVIGGGDGGSSEEALKHPAVERLTLVELDPAVVELARAQFQSIHKGVFDNPRLELVIEDGLKYVAGTRERFDLIVLDLMLPGRDGLSVCRSLRAAENDIAIIMLTAKGDEIDRIVGLEMGADDYLPKPFNPRELTARIQAVLRRKTPMPNAGAPSVEDATVRFGPYTLELSTRRLTRGDEPVPLTTGEFALLRVLASNPKVPLTREKLLDMARGREHEYFDRSVDVQVSRLRRLLEVDPGNPRYIQTVWGVGYVFVPDDA